MKPATIIEIKIVAVRLINRELLLGRQMHLQILGQQPKRERMAIAKQIIVMLINTRVNISHLSSTPESIPKC